MEGRTVGHNLKETHPGTIPARFGLIWFSGFWGEDLNVIFYQDMSNVHNRYKSDERNISQKNPEFILKKFLFLVTAAILTVGTKRNNT